MKLVDKCNWLVQYSRKKYLSISKIFSVLAVPKQKVKKSNNKKKWARNVKQYWDLRYAKRLIETCMQT